MKIHYLSSSTLISDSANSVHVTKICDAFANNGHIVTLHALHGDGEDEEIDQYYGVNKSKHFDIIRHKESEFGLNKHFHYVKKILPIVPIGGLPALIYAFFHLKRTLPKDIDLIMARNMYWLYGLNSEVPFIYESHSPPSNIFQKFIEKRLYTNPLCKGVVVISEKLKEIYMDIFPDIEDKLIVAHDAADDPGENVINIAERPFKTIGYVGHLYKGRGVEIILHAAKALPDLAFHIVGGRDDLIAAFKDSGVPENVTFFGHQPPEKLSEYFKNFDAVLAPYQRKVSVHGDTGDTSAFMSPLKIFEYMSWGIPILCSDMPVLREVLHDKKNAFLLPPDDAPSWVSALETLRDDPELRLSLAGTARKDFSAYYTWDGRVKHILGSIVL